MVSLGATDVEDGAKESEEIKATASTPVGIREYSEESFQENDGTANENKDHNAAEKKEGTSTSTPESLEESQDHREARTASDEEYERDVAQQKNNRRARAQPGAKRGGRRDTGRGGWRRWGRRKHQFEAGDLVEAEWKASGWWYVGYIGAMSTKGEESKDDTTITSGSAREAKAGKKQKGMFHVVFADGDEADVLGKNLKPLRTKGTPRDADVTALPGHIPVVDVGSGRLHGGLEPPSHKTQAAGITTSRQGSAGSIGDRRRQGDQALWGGRGAPSGSPIAADGSSGREQGGEWWETGTSYAFQPRLAADISTAWTFVKRGGRYGAGVGGEQRKSPGQEQHGGGGGGDDGGANHDAAPPQQGRGRGRVTAPAKDSGRALMRIVKAPEGNEDHGQRVFFLA